MLFGIAAKNKFQQYCEDLVVKLSSKINVYPHGETGVGNKTSERTAKHYMVEKVYKN